MNFYARISKVFAVSFLLFANLLVVSGQRDSIYRLPAGTKIVLSMDSEISSKRSAVDDTFTATVLKPISIRDSVVLPAGTVIEGRVTKVSDAEVGGKNGLMNIRFETIHFANKVKRQIDGVLVEELKVPSSKPINVLVVVGGTALGVVFGAVSKIDNGALIAGGIGAGAGAGVALLRKGKNVYIRTKEEFVIELKNEVTLPVSDY